MHLVDISSRYYARFQYQRQNRLHQRDQEETPRPQSIGYIHLARFRPRGTHIRSQALPIVIPARGHVKILPVVLRAVARLRAGAMR
jgi:hypothetical protein